MEDRNWTTDYFDRKLGKADDSYSTFDEIWDGLQTLVDERAKLEISDDVKKRLAAVQSLLLQRDNAEITKKHATAWLGVALGKAIHHFNEDTASGLKAALNQEGLAADSLFSPNGSNLVTTHLFKFNPIYGHPGLSFVKHTGETLTSGAAILGTLLFILFVAAGRADLLGVATPFVEWFSNYAGYIAIGIGSLAAVGLAMFLSTGAVSDSLQTRAHIDAVKSAFDLTDDRGPGREPGIEPTQERGFGLTGSGNNPVLGAVKKPSQEQEQQPTSTSTNPGPGGGKTKTG